MSVLRTNSLFYLKYSLIINRLCMPNKVNHSNQSIQYYNQLYLLKSYQILIAMEPEKTLDSKKLQTELHKQTEWAKAVIFNEKGIIAHKNCNARKEQLSAYFRAYESRDNTIGEGFTLLNEHYDVHRFHPPLIYGRRGNAQNGEGISLGVGKTKQGEKVYMIITYVLPIISARAIPQQINFFNDFIGELEKFN